MAMFSKSTPIADREVVVAGKILELNTENAHNRKERIVEVIRNLIAARFRKMQALAKVFR